MLDYRGLVRIELLAFEGCPNVEKAELRIIEALKEEHCSAEISRVEISNLEQALALRFLGSPSVRVNGEDVEPSANNRDAFGFMCRTYTTGTVTDGSPPIAMIRAAIRRFI
jgi:hypothetical protein